MADHNKLRISSVIGLKYLFFIISSIQSVFLLTHRLTRKFCNTKPCYRIFCLAICPYHLLTIYYLTSIL